MNEIDKKWYEFINEINDKNLDEIYDFIKNKYL